jgi:hypothetical protein
MGPELAAPVRLRAEPHREWAIRIKQRLDNRRRVGHAASDRPSCSAAHCSKTRLVKFANDLPSAAAACSILSRSAGGNRKTIWSEQADFCFAYFMRPKLIALHFLATHRDLRANMREPYIDRADSAH